MSDLYFSEHELGRKPRTENEIGASVWGGLVAFINALIDSGYFCDKFPELCPDNDGVIGTNRLTMSMAVSAEFPKLSIPLHPNFPKNYTYALPGSWISKALRISRCALVTSVRI